MKNNILLISLIAIVLLTMLWFFGGSAQLDNPSFEENEAVAKKSKSGPGVLSEENHKQVKPEGLDEGAVTNSSLGKKLTSAIGNSNQSKIKNPWWYRTPTLENEEKFSPANTLLSLDASCINSGAFDETVSIEKNFEKTHKVNGRERYPGNVFYFALTQFWKLEENYYQFVAIWDRDMPALYRYEFYRSQDPNFENSVEPIDIPIGIPSSTDVISTNRFVSELLGHYSNLGAELGARILESSINNPEGDEQLTFINARLTQWHTPKFSCDSNADHQSSYCICNSGGNA